MSALIPSGFAIHNLMSLILNIETLVAVTLRLNHIDALRDGECEALDWSAARIRPLRSCKVFIMIRSPSVWTGY